MRHGEQYGNKIAARRPGWSLDLVQSYNSLGAGSRYTGQLGLTGLTRSDWGVRWNHSHEFSTDTRATFFLDFPQHRSVYASTNLQRQMGPFLMGANLSGNRTLTGFSSTGMMGDLYLETVPKRVAKTGYTYALAATAGYSDLKAGPYSNRAMTEGLQARFNSSTFRLDRETTLTNYFTVGNAWSVGGQSGMTALASLSANRTMKHANLQVSYDYTRQPTFLFDGSHRVSANFLATPNNRWNFMLYASTMLDAPSSSVVADLNYAFLPRWRWTFSANMHRFVNGNYRDLEFGIGRTLGGREFILSYSTYTHRFFFDLQANRF